MHQAKLEFSMKAGWSREPRLAHTVTTPNPANENDPELVEALGRGDDSRVSSSNKASANTESSEKDHSLRITTIPSSHSSARPRHRASLAIYLVCENRASFGLLSFLALHRDCKGKM